MTHILIDGLNMALPYETGIGNYARNLDDALVAMGHRTSVLYGRNVRTSRYAPMREALFFADERSEKGTFPARLWRALRTDAMALAGRSDPVEIPRMGLLVRDDRFDAGGTLFNSPRLFTLANRRFRLTGKMLVVRNPGGVDVCQWTCPVPVRMLGARNVYTFHDLIPLRYPYLVKGSPSQFYRVAKAIAASGAQLVTVSEHSRRELVEHLRVREQRVTNTYQSVVVPPRASDDGAARQVYGLEEKGYFLSFSAIDPRKNIVRMIEAHVASGTTRKLVIAGKFGWLGAGDIRMLSNMGLWNAHAREPQSGGRIVFLGHVSRAHLDQLIRGARAVLFASITEGFGLPIIEAMGRGIPVLTSRGGATEEVAGGSAYLVDPLSAASIAAGIRELDVNHDLVARLAKEGPGRAAAFSLDAYRSRLATIYG